MKSFIESLILLPLLFMITNARVPGNDPVGNGISNVGSLTVTVQDVENWGPLRSTGQVSLFNAAGTLVDSQMTNSSGVATFINIQSDTGYSYAVIDNRATVFGPAYWGKRTGLTIPPDAIVNETFNRNLPYAAFARVYNVSAEQEVTGGTISVGTPLRIELEIKNPNNAGSAIHLVGGRVLLDRNQEPTFDFDSTVAPVYQSVPGGGTTIVNYYFVPRDTGVYRYALTVITDVNGTPQMTEATNWSQSFFVVNTSLLWVNATFPGSGNDVRALTSNSLGHVFAGTWNNGMVWKSLDNGQSWTQCGTLPDANPVLCLSVNSRNHLFASVWLVGMYRSTDNGASWQLKNNGLTNLAVRGNLVDRGGAVWVATEQGLFRSSDNGESWSLKKAGYFPVVFLDSTGSVITSDGNSLFRSLEGGSSWTSALLQSGLILGGVHPDGSYYAGTSTSGIYRSTDFGTTWVDMHSPVVWSGYTSCFTFNSLGHIFYARDGDAAGILVSTNNGATWVVSNDGLKTKRTIMLYYHPNGYVFVGTNGSGVFRSMIPTSPASISAALPDSSAAIGDTIIVPVTIGDVTGQDVLSYQFTVAFNAPNSILIPVNEVSTDGTLSGVSGWSVAPNINVPNQITVGAFGPTPLSGSGTLLRLKFVVSPTALNGQYSNLEFTAFQLNSGGLPVSTISGKITATKQTGAVPWTYVNTGITQTIIIPTSANPNINGSPLGSGDYVGVFYDSSGTLLCGGYERWTGTANIAVSAFGDDPTTSGKDGFASGEELKWRMFRASEGRVYDASATYAPVGGVITSRNTYVTNGISRLESLAGAFVTHTLSLRGGWSLISSYVAPASTSLDSVFRLIVSDVIILKNGGGKIFIPSEPVNTIGPWVMTEGYQIKMAVPRSLEIQGQMVVSENSAITLPSGWSIMPYLKETELSVSNALNGIVADVTMVKDQDGKTYIPSLGINSIGNLKPGQGYQIKMSRAQTLRYPSGTIPGASASRASSEKDQTHNAATPPWFFSNTGSSHTIILPLSAHPNVDGTPLAADDCIGVFYDSSGTIACAGYEIWTGAGSIAVSAFGDDPTTTVKDGLSSHETFRWKIWRHGDGRITDALAAYLPAGDLGGIVTDSNSYGTNGISAISSLRGSVTGVTEKELPKEFGLNQNYPNPFNPSTTIRYALPQRAAVQLTVFNTLGQLVGQLVNSEMEAGYHEVRFDASRLSSGVYFYRLEAGDFVQTRTLLLLK